MKMRNKCKSVNVLIIGTAMLSVFSGCEKSNNNTDNMEKNTFAATESVTAEVYETFDRETTEAVNTEYTEEITKESTNVKDDSEDTNIRFADLSFVYGAPNAVEIWACLYDQKEVNGKLTAEVDVVDTGLCYRLGIRKIKYAVGITNYRDFIDNAVESIGYTQGEDGKGRFAYRIIEENADLVCCGETFTLTSYYVNDAGRGYCEFLGEDGSIYYLNNDMSEYIDSFTSELYFKLETADGQAAYREVEFNAEYIDIPYEKAENTQIKMHIEETCDVDGGDPVGYYMTQFDADGNIVKFAGC